MCVTVLSCADNSPPQGERMFLQFAADAVIELRADTHGNFNGIGPDANGLFDDLARANVDACPTVRSGRRKTFITTDTVVDESTEIGFIPDEDDNSDETDAFNNADNSEPDDEYARMARELGDSEDWDTDYNAYEEFGAQPCDNAENGYWTPGTGVPVIKKLASRFVDEEVDYSDFGQFEEPLIVEDELDKFETLATAYRPNVRDTIRMNLRKLRDLIMNGKCRRSVPSQRSWKDSTRRPRPFRSFNGQVKRVPKALR